MFKSHYEAQKEAGLKDLQLLRNASDPNSVVCFFRVEDIEKAKAFTETPQANEAQMVSEVIGESEVLFLKEI